MKKKFNYAKMKKEAVDFGDIACELIGIGDVADTACIFFKDRLRAVFENTDPKKDNVPKKNLDETTDLFKKFQDLSNLLRQQGCTEEEFIDPDKLRISLSGPAGGNLIRFNKKDLSKITEGLRDFFATSSLLKEAFVNANAYVSYVCGLVFNYYKTTFNADAVVSQLQALSKDSIDPVRAPIAVAKITGDYYTAYLLNLLLTIGGDTSKAIEDYGEDIKTATEIFGKRSLDIMSFEKMMDEKAKTNFNKYERDVKLIRIDYDKKAEAGKIKSQMVADTGPWIEMFTNSIPIRTVNKIAAWVNGVREAVKRAAEGV